jgi:hypothetical protein
MMEHEVKRHREQQQDDHPGDPGAPLCAVRVKGVVPEREIQAPEDQDYHGSGFLQALSAVTHLTLVTFVVGHFCCR